MRRSVTPQQRTNAVLGASEGGTRRIVRRRIFRFLPAIVLTTMVASACTGGDNGGVTPAPGGSSNVQRGGVLRVGISGFGFSDGFDPTGEYTSMGWAGFHAIMRGLVTYKYAEGVAGLEVVPDLAEEIPEPTDGGLTYTFQVKSGVKWAPPLDREVTSYDIAYAFQRINTKSLIAQYGFYYYGVIAGMDGSAARPEPISGIKTPDARTIIFRLTQPTGDFLQRLTLPATYAIPPEVGKCFTQPGEYGQDIIASGPYMIQGSADINVSSCQDIEPMAGFDETKQLTLERNPNYDPATDTQTGRKDYVDGIQITVNSSVSDIFQKVQSGELDTSWGDTPPATILRQYLTDPSLKSRLHSDSTSQLAFIHMNLTTPPFDDIHVREAVNLILDKAAILKTFGGATGGQIATQVAPPLLLNDLTASYDPFATPGQRGSLTLAQAEMAQSQYDPGKTGSCTDPVCKNLVMINNNVPPWTDAEGIVVDSLAKIGIQVVPRELDSGAAYNTVQKVSNQIPISMNMTWLYDYPDVYIYLAVFSTDFLAPDGNANFSLVGLTPALAKELGVSYPAGGIPSVDTKVSQCQAASGAERLACWVEVDKQVTEEIVPYAPMLVLNRITVTGADVTAFQFSPAATAAFTQYAVSNGLTLQP